MMNDSYFKNPKAEVIHIRGLYRKFILANKVNLPYESLKNLIGPDCAYHLYKMTDNEK